MIEAVIFDLDGTIAETDLDFAAIKKEIGMGTGPVLEHRATVEPDEQARIDAILDRHELAAAQAARLNHGACELLEHLRSARISTALLTRNSRSSADIVCEKFGLSFDVVVCREDAPPKPSPEPVLFICDRLDVLPGRALMVGDYLFDIHAGQAAGSPTVLLTNGKTPRFECEPTYVVDRLTELIPIIDSLRGTAGADAAEV